METGGEISERSEMCWKFWLQVILELLRYVQITPVLVPHMAVQDATLGGYFVPKNTRVRLGYPRIPA